MPREPTFERPLPSSPETERAAIGSVFMDNALMDEAITILKPDDFYVPSNRNVFSAMIELHTEHSAINPITVANCLVRNGVEFGGMTSLFDMEHGLPHVTTLRDYAKIIKEKSAYRWIIKETNRVCSAALEEDEPAQTLFTQAVDRFSAMKEKSTNGHQGGRLSELVSQVTDHLYTIRAGVNTAIPTGLEPLDRLTAGGIRPGEFWGIAARSSRGKSSMLVQILLSMAKAGHPVALFSLETQALTVALRILAAETGVSMGHLRAPGSLREAEIDELVRQVGSKFDIPFWIYTKGFKSVVAINRQIQTLNRKIAPQRLAAVGIDWYGKLSSGSNFGNQRTQELKWIADFLQQEVAIGQEVGLLVPAQFNRSGWGVQEPGPGNIDGGEAYHDAVDLFATLDTKMTGEKSDAKLVVYKQRNGPVAVGKDAIRLVFHRTQMQFQPRLEDLGEEVPDGPTAKERTDFL